MISFLASVRSLEEARMVLEAGVDIIDLKEPENGALGAMPISLIEEIARFVDGRKLVSATVGDLPMQPEAILRLVEATTATGVDIVKLGFFEINTNCIDALRSLMQGSVRLVAVLFADSKFSIDDIQLLAQAGFYGVMLDTAHKNGRSLCDILPLEQIEAFLKKAKQCQLKAGLAGSLRTEHIPLLSGLDPDYLGFRGALCEHNTRQFALQISQVLEVQELLQKSYASKPVLTAS